MTYGEEKYNINISDSFINFNYQENIMLKKYFPVSFRAKDVVGLIVSILIYFVIGLVAGLAIWLATAITGWIPVVGAIIGWLLGIVSTLVEIYSTVGIVIAVLVLLKVVK